MEQKDCLALYDVLIDTVCQSVLADAHTENSEAHMMELVKVLGPKFETKGGTNEFCCGPA